MPLTKEEIQKIEEEERIRAEARNRYSQKPKNNPKQKKGISTMSFFVGFLVILFLILLISGAGVFSMIVPICLFIYFLPSAIAEEKHKNNSGAILILNLLLGWTLIGWVIALVWASTND